MEISVLITVAQRITQGDLGLRARLPLGQRLPPTVPDRYHVATPRAYNLTSHTLAAGYPVAFFGSLPDLLDHSPGRTTDRTESDDRDGTPARRSDTIGRRTIPAGYAIPRGLRRNGTRGGDR
jgi:hypothetical protein